MCSVAHMVAGCTDVDLRRAQGCVSEERLHDVHGFATAYQLHRHRVPQGMRCRPTRGGALRRGRTSGTRRSSCGGERPAMVVEPCEILPPPGCAPVGKAHWPCSLQSPSCATAFTGSYKISANAERNAENQLHISRSGWLPRVASPRRSTRDRRRGMHHCDAEDPAAEAAAGS
jgi:hypothetical protein